VQVPQAQMTSVEDAKNIPVANREGGALLLRNVADVTEDTTVGQYERYNMQRTISLTANIHGADLGSVSKQVARAIAQLGEPPAKVSVTVRGQIVPMQQMMNGLRAGLLLAVGVIFLLLAANFQSLKLSFVVISTVPAVIAGAVIMLWLTRTTLNIESFMGAIMAVGVAVANAILLVTFAERARMGSAAAPPAPVGASPTGTARPEVLGEGPEHDTRGRVCSSSEAAIEGARSRLRPILMTSCAMIAGMLPMAIGIGEGAEQTAPLGRAVIGGLIAATLATLFFLPSVFSIVQSRAHRRPASLISEDQSQLANA
jgi:multidrug efflux pump subunit AcrB